MRRFAARYVYPLTDAEPLVNAFVELDDDGTVLATGPCPDPSAEPCFYEGALVPGFVNAHCHVELSYMKGLFRRGTGMAGFIDQINALRDTCPEQEKIRALSAEMDRMWRSGVSAMADISNCADSFAAKAAAPMYTRTFLEVFGTEPEDCDAVMEGVFRLQAQARAFGLDAAPTPHACYTMSPELLTAASRAALQAGFLSYHSEETEEEEEMIRSGSGPMWENRRAAGMSVPPVTGTSSLRYFIRRLEAAQPAPFGAQILLVHEVCMDADGIAAVRAVMPNAYVALCPRSNLFIHNALPPVELLRGSGIPLCVGTDSLSSNDSLDMVAELYCLQTRFPEIPLGELLTWACRNGAAFLRRSELGTLEAGRRPGLVLIDHLDGRGGLTARSRSQRLV